MKRSFPLLLAVAIGGCASLQAEHVITGQAREPAQGKVQVMMQGAPDPAAFEEIGIVTARGTLSEATLPAVIGALQREAATIGADAVIHVRYDAGANGASATGVAVKLQR